MLGDLEDLEKGAVDCDLLITHAHGRQASERLGKPVLRIGFPVFDRIGNAHKRMVGYRGTMDFIFEFATTMLANTIAIMPKKTTALTQTKVRIRRSFSSCNSITSP